MSDSVLVILGLAFAMLVEGSNGFRFALSARRTLEAVKLSYDDGPGLLLQEFGVYSLALASAYLLAILDPIRRPGIVVVGILINLTAGSMHLARSAGVYFGDAKPMLPHHSERNQGLVHALSFVALCVAWAATGVPVVPPGD